MFLKVCLFALSITSINCYFLEPWDVNPEYQNHYSYAIFENALNFPLCSGALITYRHILTVAVCYWKAKYYLDQAQEIRVRAGTDLSAHGEVRNVLKFSLITYENKRNNPNDITIATLLNAFSTYNLHIKPTKIALQNSLIYPNTHGQIIGRTRVNFDVNEFNEIISTTNPQYAILTKQILVNSCYSNRGSNLVCSHLQDKYCWGMVGDPVFFKNILIAIANSDDRCNSNSFVRISSETNNINNTVNYPL